MKSRTPRIASSILVLASVFTLAACNRTDDNRTAGQKLDSAIAKTEQKSEELGKDLKQGMEKAQAGANDAMQTAAAKTQDAAITTQVNAELARDPELSALKIDVDTVNGHVVLKGTAPSETARERAVTMAKTVNGVVDVDNQLRVGS